MNTFLYSVMILLLLKDFKEQIMLEFLNIMIFSIVIIFNNNSYYLFCSKKLKKYIAFQRGLNFERDCS